SLRFVCARLMAAIAVAPLTTTVRSTSLSTRAARKHVDDLVLRAPSFRLPCKYTAQTAPGKMMSKVSSCCSRASRHVTATPIVEALGPASKGYYRMAWWAAATPRRIFAAPLMVEGWAEVKPADGTTHCAPRL